MIEYPPEGQEAQYDFGGATAFVRKEWGPLCVIRSPRGDYGVGVLKELDVKAGQIHVTSASPPMKRKRNAVRWLAREKMRAMKKIMRHGMVNMYDHPERPPGVEAVTSETKPVETQPRGAPRLAGPEREEGPGEPEGVGAGGGEVLESATGEPGSEKAPA